MVRKKTSTHKPPKSRPRDVPQYEKVADALRKAILDGDTDRPTRIPSDRDLRSIHNVSRITIAKAMEILVRDCLVQRSHTYGTSTVPEGIQRWKRLRQGGIIHLLTTAKIEEHAPSSYYARICQGVRDRAEQGGYRLSHQRLATFRRKASMDLLMPQEETSLGIIFVGLMNENMIRLFTETGYPVVCVDYWTTDPRADAIVVDCYTEGQEGADFLLRQGHTNMFYLGNRIGWPKILERESDSELLLAGMQRALLLAGLPPMGTEQIRFLGNGEEDARQAVQWWASLDPRPTSGIIFNDGLCRRFLEQLDSLGLHCPNDVSVITKAWEDLTTEATCFRCPARPLGELAVETLLNRVARPRERGMRLALPSVLDRGRTVRQVTES